MIVQRQPQHSISIGPLSGWSAIGLGDTYDTQLIPWHDGLSVRPIGNFAFGYICSGTSCLTTKLGKYELITGMFFAGPTDIEVTGGSGIMICGSGEPPIFVIGGPIEDTGRLRYIDGCRDTLLIPPTRRGNACLNALYFPAGTNQTLHTHPSVRVGVVVKGKGLCKCSDSVSQLHVGDLFVIPPNALHAFSTSETDMAIIAYHPDSDTGPTDDDHPMINRTFVKGVSASQIDSIRTQG